MMCRVLKSATATISRENISIDLRWPSIHSEPRTSAVAKGPEAVDRAFEAFHSSKGQGGTGLGLASAKKIVTELHGEIGVEQNDLPGACIFFALPVVSVTLSDEESDEPLEPSVKP